MSLGAIAALGCLAAGARNQDYTGSQPAQPIAPFMDGSEVTVTAHVVRDGVVRVLGGDRRQVVEIESEEMAGAEETHAGARVPQTRVPQTGDAANAIRVPHEPVQAGIRLTIYSREEAEDSDSGESTSAHHQLVYGERLRFSH